MTHINLIHAESIFISAKSLIFMVVSRVLLTARREIPSTNDIASLAVYFAHTIMRTVKTGPATSFTPRSRPITTPLLRDISLFSSPDIRYKQVNLEG